MRADKIRELANRLELPDEQIARDFLQSKLLGSIFVNATKDEILLKGGLAMRAAFGSRRLTKDVDLQSDHKVPMARVRSIVMAGIRAAMESGLLEHPHVTEPKQTETVQRWKIGGMCGKTEISMTVEVSRRGLPPSEHRTEVKFEPMAEYGLAPVIIDTYSPTAIAAGKVLALLSHNRSAPRDIYDLQMLVTMEVRPPVELIAAVGVGQIEEMLTSLWDKLELMPYSVARDALVDYMPKDVMASFNEDTWEDFRLRTGQAVEGWLKESLEIARAAVPH